MPTRSFVLLLAGVIVAAAATVAVAALAGSFADPAALSAVVPVTLAAALALRFILSRGAPRGRR